jgi:hypothetical protein
MPFEMSDEFRLLPAHLRTRDFSREGCERTDIPLPAALRAGQAVYKPVFAPNFRISDCENGFSDQSGALGGELWPTRHELVAGVHVSCVMKIVVESHRCRIDVGLQRVVGIAERRQSEWTIRASIANTYRQAGVYTGRILKGENHACAVALHAMYYNFVRIDQTLKVTPAMAVGVTDRLWEMSDVVDVIEAFENRGVARLASM